MPLLFILVVAAVKEIIEDLVRLASNITLAWAQSGPLHGFGNVEITKIKGVKFRLLSLKPWAIIHIHSLFCSRSTI